MIMKYNLMDTTVLMMSKNYTINLICEYLQTSYRYEKIREDLEKCLVNGDKTEQFILEKQQKSMFEYLFCLEKRLEKENINPKEIELPEINLFEADPRLPIALAESFIDFISKYDENFYKNFKKGVKEVIETNSEDDYETTIDKLAKSTSILIFRLIFGEKNDEFKTNLLKFLLSQITVILCLKAWGDVEREEK